MGLAGILEAPRKVYTIERVGNELLELLAEDRKTKKSKYHIFEIHFPIR